MKISEFVLTKVIGKTPLDLEYFASVSVTTGVLWWKKVERRHVHKKYAGNWVFVDTGEWTPGYQVEALERAYKAQEKLKD